MSAIRSKDTKPEMQVRRLVHGMGYRFRLGGCGLPGKPDLVLPRHRKVIFVHGCFWHRHKCPEGRVVPATRKDFWTAKFEANHRRDFEALRDLEILGWASLVIWECRLRSPDLIERRIEDFLAGYSTEETN